MQEPIEPLHETPLRRPMLIDGQAVGSVLSGHLPALGSWPQWLRLAPDGVHLLVDSGPARDDALAQMNAALRRLGLIRGWRDELIALLDPVTGAKRAVMERAAARFWGTLTLGVHANGYVADAWGRPTHLWIARRAANKATDPGLLDNMVGGGVGDGQTPLQALVREAWEEAGLDAATLAQAKPGGLLRLQRSVPEGLQLEDLHSYDLRLPADLVPVNQDGEVAHFECMTVAQAVCCARRSGMTVDAALVTLDFARRHQLLAE